MANNAVVKDASVIPPKLYFPLSQDYDALFDYAQVTVNYTLGTNAFTGDVIFSKIGRNVTCQILPFGPRTVMGGSPALLLSGNDVPARFRPATNVWAPCRVNYNGIQILGGIILKNNGSFEMSRNVNDATYGVRLDTAFANAFTVDISQLGNGLITISYVI